MSIFSADTDPEAAAVLVEGYRRMSPTQKIARAADLSAAARALAAAGVRNRYPAADEHEVALRVAALTLDRESMVRVFGWDPAQHP